MGSLLMVLQPRWGWGWGGTVKWPDWEKESYPAAKDLLLIPVFAVLFPTVRFLFDNLILERVGRKAICGAQQPFILKDMEDYQHRRLMKFKESAWKGLYYLTAELFALAVTYNEPWFTESKQFWIGPGDQRWPNQMTRLKLKVLYGFAGGFYTYSIFALMFWETKRKDFGVSMSHHVAAVVLIIFSYLSRFARVGSVVLAIHDANDVILELAKLSKYLGFEVCASIAFVLFVVSWVLLRLIYFPSFVIWSTSYEVLQLLDRETNPHGPVLYYIFNTLLISLFILHIYWWVLMWRMIVKQVQDWGKISDDIRSDSEDEGDMDKED
jgi:ceramide synthetase